MTQYMIPHSTKKKKLNLLNLELQQVTGIQQLPTFRLYVVGDDPRADNTMMQIGTGIFTADITYIRVPNLLDPVTLVLGEQQLRPLVLDVIDPTH